VFGNCGIGQPPATSLPWAGNMAYYGGAVQTHPKEYLIYWGWGESNGADKTTAFPGQTCTPETFSEGTITATLPCDPDGAGKYMADFVYQMGGTDWANVSTQYYMTDAAGNQTFVSNDKNVLAGIWVDNGNDITQLPKTNSSNPAGPTNTFWNLAQEASRAATHFGVTDTTNANFVIIQPPAYSDPNAIASGYCAFHDFTESGVPGNFYYQGVQQHLAYTNMPYSLAINSGGVNVCGENAVNTDPAGKLDGFSIVLGHEIEETITDPGAESVVGSAPGTQTAYGAWYDATDPNENGDKCAWVGENELTLQGPPLPIAGALGDINGNAGERFAVQSLWSNAANQGTGYCAGAGTDSPVPSAPYGTTPSTPSSGSGSGGGSSSSSGGPSGGGTTSSTPTASSGTVKARPHAVKRAIHRSKHHRRHALKRKLRGRHPRSVRR
jgi:hypothetical protein